ncbi:hypothetical protein RB595_000284 [Gaeumannomyces hyphopodioides]
MAVMTSPQQSTPTLVEQKAVVKMATIPDAKREEENGVNGHVSPSPNGIKPADPEAPPPAKADSPVAPEDAADSATEAQKGDTIASNPEVEESAKPATESAPSGTTEEKDKRASESRDEPSASAAKPDEPPKDAVPIEEEGRDSEMVDAPIDQPSPDTSPDKPASKQDSPSRDPDATPAADPAPTAAPAESTLETAASTAAEPKPQPPSLSDLAIESQKSAEAAETVDTNMADADAPLSSSSKVSRERDEDPSDEPAAKRARTEPTEVEVAAKPEADAQPSVEAEPASTPQADLNSMKAEADPMDVDDTGFGLDRIPPYPDAEPGNLMHPGADNEPIPEGSVRAIKNVLSGVKKTKAGANFKDSVANLWPGLAESYSAKVTNPMDISLMERKLRSSAYATLGDFKADVKLLVTNSVAFNGAIHTVTDSAVSVVENIWDRMHKAKVEEPSSKAPKKDKSANIRHTERSAAAHQPRPKPTPTPAYVAPTVPAASASFTQAPSKPAVDKALSAKAGESSTPVRRDSTKDDDRPKRPIHPPKKDLAYEAKGTKKKKLSPELRFCEDVLKDLMRPKHQAIHWPFLKPVDEVRDGAVGYFAMIKKPMDLGTIGNKLHTGAYANAEGFRHDLDLMLTNCFLFNPTGTEVNNVGKNLQSWINGKWVDINTYVAKASAKGPRRPSASSPGAAAKDGSDDEAPSEAEAEQEAVESKEEIELKKALEALVSKLEVTKKELIECLKQEGPDMAQVDIHHSIIKMLSEGAEEKKKKLQELVDNRLAAKTRSAPTKPKKSASSASANASTAPKKPSGGASKKSGGGGGSNSKKSATKRPLTDVEKQAIANGINDLDEPYITTAIEIIMKDSPKNKENGNGELELEIDALSLEALHKLYDLMCKGIKGFRGKVEAKIKEETQVSAPPVLNQPPQKPRKNKPMGKGEQELKIEHLAKLKSQFRGGRQGSGSQEPPPSNETASAAEPAQADDDSDVSSEED